MKQKTVYQTDHNGVYLWPTEADESPLEPGVWLIPGGCVEEAPPEVGEGQAAQWDGEAWHVVALPPPPEPEQPYVPTIEDKIGVAWAEADEAALKIADHNERERYLMYLIDPSTPDAAKALIMQKLAIMDDIWAQYAAQRAAIEAGGEPEPLNLPESWPTIWDIKRTVEGVTQ